MIDTFTQPFPCPCGNPPLIHDFLAIDFETAQSHNPCQIGIAVVRDGEIVETINQLIRPEGNQYSPYTIAVHHITPEMTEDAPSFPEIWEQISGLFDNAWVVAHNAPFDLSVLRDTLIFYNLPLPHINGVICTCELNDGENLELACARYDISLTKHHDGEDDAINCARLYLAHINGERRKADYELPEELFYRTKHKGHLAFNMLYEGHEVLRGDVLQKDLEGADTANPFYNRKVVITGVFEMDRLDLAQKIKSMGADIDTNIGKKLNYIIIGKDPGPSKLCKVDRMIEEGHGVRKIYQDDLDAIFEGQKWDFYHTELPVVEKKTKPTKIRKTTWPDLCDKYERFVNGDSVELNERELASEDYHLLSLYYTQQQKIPSSKATVLANIRQLTDDDEARYRSRILSLFCIDEYIGKLEAYERIQMVFDEFNLTFKPKTCVLTEMGFEFEEYKIKGIHYLHIISMPPTES